MDPFEIIFDGDFGWEINARSLNWALQEANGKDLLIKASSPGGSVSEATIIRNSLEAYAKKHDAVVTFEVTGWVQSAMTYVMTMKGAWRIIHPDSMWMYHNPTASISGDHASMSEAGEFLASLTDVYAASYAEQSGKSLEDVKADMAKTTAFVGQAIIDNGFADEMDATELGHVDGGPAAVVAFGKEQFNRCVGRLAVAACGHDVNVTHDTNTMLPGGSKTPPAKKENTDMSKEKEDVKTLEMEAQQARVTAWSGAMQAAPVERHKYLTECLASGKSADFFEGLTATYVMNAEASKLQAAGGATPPVMQAPEVNPPKPEKEHPATVGMTGEMLVI